MPSGAGAQYVPTAGAPPVKQWLGLYDAYVAVNQDPTASGKIKLRVPQVFGNVTSGWSSPMSPVTFIPRVGSKVACMFVGGDPTRPVWFTSQALPVPPPVVIMDGPPTDSTPGQLGEIWYDSSDGMRTYTYNGAGWVAFEIGTGALASGIGITEPRITGGVITGSNFVAIGTQGEFLGYSSTPASGNMNLSISAAEGTDSFGNTYGAGLNFYNGTANIQTHVNETVGAPAIEMTTGIASEAGGSALYTWSPNRGASTEYLQTNIQGPESSGGGGSASVIMTSGDKSGASTANGNLIAGSAVIGRWNSGGFNVFGALAANGSTTLENTLTVEGAIQADSDVHVSGTLWGISGALTIGDRVAVTNAGGLSVTGPVTASNFSGNYTGSQSAVSTVAAPSSGTWTAAQITYLTTLASAINGLITRLHDSGVTV